jgi:hypothetical protein
LKILSPQAEFVAGFTNEDNEPEPRLRYCAMRKLKENDGDSSNLKASVGDAEMEAISYVDTNKTKNKDCIGGAKDLAKLDGSCLAGSCGSVCPRVMSILWEIHEVERRLHSTNLKIENQYNTEAVVGAGCPVDREVFELCRSAASAKGVSMELHLPILESTNLTSEGAINLNQPFGASKYVYLLRDYVPKHLSTGEPITVELDTWKPMVQQVWEMRCAFPTFRAMVQELHTPRETMAGVCADAQELESFVEETGGLKRAMPNLEKVTQNSIPIHASAEIQEESSSCSSTTKCSGKRLYSISNTESL